MPLLSPVCGWGDSRGGYIPSTPTMSVQRIDSIDRAVETLLKAFHKCPSNNFLNSKFCDVPLEAPQEDPELADELTKGVIMYYYNHDAEIVQAGDYDAVAIWTVPGKPVPVDRTKDAKFNEIFIDQSQRMKEQVIPKGMPYYYLFMIGKDLKSGKRGAVRAIFEKYIARAEAEGAALVLEAIAEHAREVYEYFGFRTYLTMNYGRGEVDSEGNVDPNGEGHKAYLMIYLPASKAKL